MTSLPVMIGTTILRSCQWVATCWTQNQGAPKKPPCRLGVGIMNSQRRFPCKKNHMPYNKKNMEQKSHWKNIMEEKSQKSHWTFSIFWGLLCHTAIADGFRRLNWSWGTWSRCCRPISSPWKWWSGRPSVFWSGWVVMKSEFGDWKAREIWEKHGVTFKFGFGWIFGVTDLLGLTGASMIWLVFEVCPAKISQINPRYSGGH